MIDPVHRYPHNIVVAVLADVGRLDMCRILASCIGAVVAADAASDSVRVVEECRCPGNRRVAIVTIVTTVDMGWMLTCSYRAVMAGGTAAYNLRMVDPVCGCKEDAVMTVLADIGRLDMRRVLADGLCAVVAAEAIARYVDVIEVGRYPTVGRVAIVTGIAACDVSRVFTDGNCAVVAGGTSTNNLRMIDCDNRCKKVSGVAILTNCCGLYVIGTLASRVNAVMAADTVAGDVDMVEERRYPAVSLVAVIALFVRGYMVD